MLVGGKKGKRDQTNEREETFTTRVGSLHKRIAAGMDGWMDGEGFEVEGVEIRCIEGGKKKKERRTEGSVGGNE